MCNDAPLDQRQEISISGLDKDYFIWLELQPNKGRGLKNVFFQDYKDQKCDLPLFSITPRV